MVAIHIPPSDVEEIRSEIAKIDAQIRGIDESVEFYTKLLNGAPEQMLFSQEEIEAAPYLEKEQRVLFPAIAGALQRDATYRDLFFDPSRGIQPTIIDPYETERRALDGKYSDFTIPGPLGPGSGLFDENLIQVSGGNRILPLFDPGGSGGVVEPVHPSQTPPNYLLFGGSSYAVNHEKAELANELALIASLLTPTCQVYPKPVSCQTDHSDLIASLLARYNPAGPSGFLVVQQAALTSNPDLSSFPSNPLAAVLAEQARVDAFRTALVAIPMTDPVPPSLLTANQAAATARQSFITTVRIPEMDSFLNVMPGYYNSRYNILRRRIAAFGTVHEVKFYQQVIGDAPAKKADLMAQRAFLESLIPS